MKGQMAVSKNWVISKANYYADFIIVPIVIALSIALAGFSLPYFLLGTVLWSLTEYLIHRYLFHIQLRNKHWLHHINEGSYVGVSTVKTTAILLFLLALSLLLGSASLYSGFAFGYFLYIVIHDAIHHENILSRYIPNLKRAHIRHHEIGDEMNFGVITLIWDRIFRTYKW